MTRMRPTARCLSGRWQGLLASIAAAATAAVMGLPGCGEPARRADLAGEVRTRVTGSSGGGASAALAARAAMTLEHSYYTGAGTWNMCVPAICRKKNLDWGADSLTYALYLHWQLAGDGAVAPIMTALTTTAHQYGPADKGWSDVPVWDAIADVREYQVTGDPAALAKAEAAFAEVDSFGARAFAAGGGPPVDYPPRDGGRNELKSP